ncbi:hypothetical protein DFP93_101219 [Aneurinibacillus soli]|uniref:Uncharacterized protein n=1 Tax=Aneurinibacillus soli TaxID=1500254 RepID=A0A0U5B428_9BACL|nr:hypothetical protein [Aneurinibacillus soli]PYE64194.1 hypothetical protein DFP93_101219 [Aneurinibacillus soli]BAU28143.1 hypothetical protein CB4_02317 [Aneurinibacillus soli]
MTKEKIIEFLFKRIQTKFYDVKDILGGWEEVHPHMDDMKSYLEFLQEVVEEAIKP